METVRWEDEKVVMIDQSKLPNKLEYLELTDYKEVADVIKNMKVRGAPAIGVSAAFGLLLAAKNGSFNRLKNAADELKKTRPTAVNLFWAIDEVMEAAKNSDDWEEAVREKAFEIFREDREVNRKIGDEGARVLESGDSVLTHCNAGALATSGEYGTALGVIKRAVEKGIDIDVYCTETRPVLQGARLTAYELVNDVGVDATLIADNAVGITIKDLDKVVVGADRVVKDGIANKIGTYNIAVLANRHDVDFYVAAPYSTFDDEKTIDEIEIEERDQDEIKEICGCKIAPDEIRAFNPAFDTTPAELIQGVITEKGIVELPKERFQK
ncbi:S-methyl-5-thioribose-1-phosphate isomerase [archaeon SCG-AAA382B04]|nr:S-methyl-5-thioribose-1-phosphate isomerase [archaeon SCG-AAA382B04]